MPRAFNSIEVIHGDGGVGSIKKISFADEKISYEIRLGPSPDGRAISKTTSKYYPLDGVDINEEEIKIGQERSGAMLKVLEDHLIQNAESYV
ncbi:unnamed protein product [Thlaspi arvense]|uniref:Bet v I/Major latex protein domain-containing protein n=1 Tax=Thlaspi arvense TaxID=13288 RepID=A0AAU9T8I6_THLAR|nr:unnamed protein product [Thlaspi arvense]